MTNFDGAAELLRAWGAGLRPDPDLTVSQWADRHQMLSGRVSVEPGRYRTERTPYSLRYRRFVLHYAHLAKAA
ncbi:MAG: hypothetical protein H3C33_07070, partial [Rhodocyclaceae bacterium]|nr:hypothetical protein [Rhodocyclaceae bacterium]